MYMCIYITSKNIKNPENKIHFRFNTKIGKINVIILCIPVLYIHLHVQCILKHI